MKDYPLIESFVIEVYESWTELDVFKTTPTRYTTIDSLGKVYPSRVDHKQRDYYAIDLQSLLKTCYVSRSKERQRSSNYPSSFGDGRDVSFWAVCRINYKNEGEVAAPKKPDVNE